MPKTFDPRPTPAQAINAQSFDAIVARIVGLYADASAEDVAAGREWYSTMQTMLAQAAHGRASVSTAAGILAATSPMVTVGRNLSITDTILTFDPARDARPAAADLRLGLHRNIDKGVSIRYGSDPADVLAPARTAAGEPTGAMKVWNFWRNIMGDTDGVTVDVWATRLALGCAVKSQPQAAAYRTIAAAYRAAAAQVGETPRDLQAIVWVAGRGSAW